VTAVAAADFYSTCNSTCGNLLTCGLENAALTEISKHKICVAWNRYFRHIFVAAGIKDQYFCETLPLLQAAQ